MSEKKISSLSEINKHRKVTDDEIRQFYNDGYLDRLPTQDNGRIRQIVERLPVQLQGDVVDFACGNGLLYPFIREKHTPERYHGVDFSEELITEARKLYPETNFHCGDIIEFCNAHEQSFDIAFTLDFSEHIYDDVFQDIYSAIRKSLKPEGVLVLHTPNLDYIMEILKDNGISKQLPGHIAVRNARQYEQLLKQCGYSEVEVHYLPHYNRKLRWLKLFDFIPAFRARLLIVAHK